MTALGASETSAQQAAAGGQTAATATITVRADREIGRIDRHIYGHFLESAFFGNIEGGVFDEGSPLSLTEPGARNGLRRDVIEACRELGVPIVRWPGGNFTSSYHWQDGIGPRDSRPRRLDLNWGDEESNRFGTDEFLAWCSEVGAEPYLVHSCRDVEEAVRWVEYTNYAGDTEQTRRRADNGHPDPYHVRHWGVGNEVYGPWQMGNRSPEEHAAAAREHARFMRLVDPSLQLIAVGAPRLHGARWNQERWTQALLEQAGNLFDYVSLHLYGASTHLYTTTPHDEYDAVVAQSLHFEREIADYSDLVCSLAQKSGVERPLSLTLDEWTMRHLEPADWPQPLPCADGGAAPRDLTPVSQRPRLRVNRWSPRTLADALFYAGVFHGLHRLSGRPVAPRMANTVNLVNANALIVARERGVVKASTYHVWDLYQNHLGPVAAPVEVDAPARWGQLRLGDQRNSAGGFHTRGASIPCLDAVATRSEDGTALQLAVINRHRSDAVTAQIRLDGHAAGLPPTAHLRELGTGVTDVMATNSFDAPGAVALQDRGVVKVESGAHTFPAHSVTLLSFDL